MPTPFERDVHDLLAEIRALCTSLSDRSSGIAQNAGVGINAYGRSPQAAIWVLASMCMLRVERRDEILDARDQSGGFPRTELDALLLPRDPSPRRPSADEDCLNFLEAYVAHPGPDVAPIETLIKTHGLIGFMRMAHINNLLGQLLVDVDDSFGTLGELMAAEALADETEYMTWGDG